MEGWVISAIIEDVRARKIYNSRGRETVEVEVETESGLGVASAPSGASRGKGEVVPFPEGGVEEAIRKVEEIVAPELIGMDAEDQRGLDLTLHDIDGTEDFSNIGGNVAFAISLGAAEAAADSYDMLLFQYLGGNLEVQLPLPLGNVLGGGKHTRGKAPDIQEFLVLPVGASSFKEAAELNFKIHRKVGELLEKADVSFNGGRGDEGAWTANISNREALNIVKEAVDSVSDLSGVKCAFGVDVAASSLWDSEKELYVYSREGTTRSREEQLEYILELIDEYNLSYVEDPFHEDDFESFAELTKAVKGCLICGDDLYVTNKKRLERGISLKSANSIIIKVNQVGTLTDAWEAIKLARSHGYVTIVSHRSGETTDVKISHLAVGLRSPIIKCGVVGGGRVAKINELLRIEGLFEDKASIAQIKL